MKWNLIIFSLLLASCASQTAQRETSSTADGTPAEVTAPARYLAWYDGDFQTDYQIDRATAEAKLKEFDEKAPSLDQVDDYLEYVSVLDAGGKTQEAEKKIRAFMEKYPNDKRGAFLLGVHFWRLNKKELTNYFFNQLEKDATFPWKSLLYNNLGMLALQDKNRILAISYFEKATKANPPTAAPFVNLGALYLKSRSWPAAEAAFAKAHELDPEFEDAALGLGVALEGQGKNEEAHQVYNDFATAHPGSSSVVYNDALVLGNRLGKKEEAAQLMLRYIQRGGKETAKAHEVIQTWQ